MAQKRKIWGQETGHLRNYTFVDMARRYKGGLIRSEVERQ